MERILLPPDAFENVRERFEAKAEALVDSLVSAGSFDAVTGFVEVFPVQAFADEVGVPEVGRENLLLYADIVFNGQGPRNELFDAATENAEEIQEWIASSCERENLAPDGFGAQIYEAADEGEITEEQAGMLVRSLLSAGLDTTVGALGSAIHLLATHPDQWEQLRADPSLARPVFEETIRFESPVQQFFRTAAHDTELAGVEIAEDDRVMVFFGSANRDPRVWEDPDRFDVTRKSSGHLAFGTGIHGCLGQLVARTEGEVLFAALARKVERIELDGEPQRHLNNSVRKLASLPVTFYAPYPRDFGEAGVQSELRQGLAKLMAEDPGPKAPSGPLWEDTPVPFEEALDGILGFQVLHLTDESARGRVAVTDRVRQMWGLAHGGVYMALAEMLASEATVASVHDDGMIAVGLSNHTSFLRPVAEGTIHAEAQRLHGGKTTWLWEVYFKDDDDKLCAVSRVTLAVRSRPDDAQ